MNLSTQGIRNPVTPTALFLVLCTVALASVLRVPVTQMLNVGLTIVMVAVELAGAAPSEIVSDMIQPLEAEVGDVGRIRHLSATRSDGAASLSVEFEIGTNTHHAANDGNDAVASVRDDLPDGATEPVVRLDQPGAISDGASEAQDFALLDGQPVVAFGVFRATGESDLEAAENAKARLDPLWRETRPPGSRSWTTPRSARKANHDPVIETLYEGAALAVAALFSPLVARLVTPMFAADVLRSPRPAQEREDGPAMRGDLRLLGWTLRHRTATLLPTEFIPASDTGRVAFAIELPPTSTLAQAHPLGQRVTDLVAAIPEVESVFVDGAAATEVNVRVNHGEKKGSGTSRSTCWATAMPTWRSSTGARSRSRSGCGSMRPGATARRG